MIPIGDIFPAEGEFLAPDEVVITFDRGVPVAVDGETVSVAEARRMLSARGEAQRIGRGEACAALDRRAGRGCARLADAVSGEVRLVLHDGRITVA
ncbi:MULTISPECIES: argininosuccinate synthase [unclassified Amycolatopsis]|uniref:argininosuccinate synthase n=1 Tax=unclassified Amycolatopsis TaxID=2618356 RepID=UPI001FF5FA1E|nr:argininosuccinate synthase [Amycolatopsis sp. FBCC-B4732]UOX90127.1 argininosuccinate synthase [Amycolatopsis sp. FBCC-B4732]